MLGEWYWSGQVLTNQSLFYLPNTFMCRSLINCRSWTFMKLFITVPMLWFDVV
jgi:hypothetical protein